MTQCNNAPVFGTSKRLPITLTVDSPGPGQYRLEKAIKQYRHSPVYAFSPGVPFGTSVRPDVAFTTAARSPGAIYDVNPPRCHTAPAFSSRSASPETRRVKSEGREVYGQASKSATANIGPGSYEISSAPNSPNRLAPRIVFGRSARGSKDSLGATLLKADPSLSSARDTPGPASYAPPPFMNIDTRGAPKFFKPSPLPPPSVTPGFYEAPRAEAIVKAAPRVLFAKQGSQPNTGGSKSPERSVFVTTSGISPGPDSYDSLRSLNSSSKTPPTVAYSMGAGSILRTDWTKLSPDTPGPGSCLSAGFCQKDIGYITKYVKPKAAFFSRSERFVNPKVHTK